MMELDEDGNAKMQRTCNQQLTSMGRYWSLLFFISRFAEPNLSLKRSRSEKKRPSYFQTSLKKRKMAKYPQQTGVGADSKK